MLERLGKFFVEKPSVVLVMVLLALGGLPIALFLDLQNISDHNLRRQAESFNRVISSVRGYYAENVVSRILHNEGQTKAVHNYQSVPGAVPIPATLSLELGELISHEEGDVAYRFVSDYPYINRAKHELTRLETNALSYFRENPNAAKALIQPSGNLWDHRMTLLTPVKMNAGCVECHNSHPESPKKDWKVGDVRAVQSVSVHQPLALNLGSFQHLLSYMFVVGSAGLLFSALQFRLARRYGAMNAELAANNSFLAEVSLKISKYLSPQVYKSIFSGEKDVTISTERKKLTVFFSDIKDFTATTELLQPEELTQLLNEYFSEMSSIAAAHGATIDKFIGDAIVAFFGDPTTKGTTEDARACVRMALDMQKRLDELEGAWRAKGLEHPFRARMGINTGYCNVGNFGSDARMDYTIIGAEANLAARLEGIAEPGGIVLSYETFAHVKDMIEAEALEPQRFKGINREITPYRVLRESGAPEPEVTSHQDGDMLVVDMQGMDEVSKEAVLDAIHSVLKQKP